MMKKTFIAAFIGALSSFALAQQTGLPTTQLSVAGKQILAELATNDQQRQLGLMFRKSLPKNDGMLFLFEQDRTV
ncbi:MAG: DUF192 domain-containing protein, partial [Burkholderiales bacterium]|nr:DUF192 domain-containing protein [Burkholderiales bacterium]